MYYVYILATNDNKMIYIGITNDLKRRVYEHKVELIEGYTKKHHINKLVYYEQTTDVYSAITREKQLKKWTRYKKNTLINKFNPNWKEIETF